MSFLSIKKSTLNLKRSILRQAHRFSLTNQPPSSKKHEHDHRSNKHEQQPPTEKLLPQNQSTPLSQQLGSLDIFVIESTACSIIYDEKINRHEKNALALFNIIIDDDNRKLSLFRFDSDVIVLEQLLKKHYGNIPSLPGFIHTTDTPTTTPPLTSSLVHNLTLRSLFTKSKTKKTNGERLEIWLRSCATHPILGRSTQLREFLSPQREQDTVVTKPARRTLSQHQHFFDPPTATTITIDKTPITLPIALLPQQPPPTHDLDQHSLLSTHSLSSSKEYALSEPIDALHYDSLNDSILDLSSILSLCWDSIERPSGTKLELDDENQEDESCNCDNDDKNDTNSNDMDDISLYGLASLLLSPLEHADDSAPTSDAAPSCPAHPLLMSCPPPFEQAKTDTPSRPCLTEPLLSPTTSQHIDPAKKPQQTSRMTFDDLQCLKVLGKGCMGKVILVRHHQSARLYALKAISKEWVITQREIDHAMMERNVLSKISKTQHPFLIKLHHSFQNANQLFLVMDYHVGSDLATQLQLHYCFDADRCRFYIAEILLGLQELHRLDILYRDLKPENILLAADGHIVLTDFGFSRLFDDDEENQLDSQAPRQLYHTRTFCGTVEYMAAEMYLSEEYTFAVDYWSLGIILYEMLLGYTPFDADNDAEMYRRVLEDPIDIPEDMPLVTSDLILGLLERNPKHRLGCAQFYYDGDSDFLSILAQDDLRQHPYFYPLDWSDVYSKQLPAPYVPHIKSETDVSHFDPDFVKLSPRLSMPGLHDDDDDDSFDIDPDSKAWTSSRYNDPYDGDYDHQQPLDDAFAGYSYINENTCVDTDSLLNEDTYQQHQQQLNDSDSASLPIVNTVSSEDHPLEFEGNGCTKKNQYHGSACAAVTTPATVTSTAFVSTESTQYYHYHHHTTSSEQPTSSVSPPKPYSNTNPHPTYSSQQLGFTRFQYRHNQQYSSHSSPSSSLI